MNFIEYIKKVQKIELYLTISGCSNNFLLKYNNNCKLSSIILQ